MILQTITPPTENGHAPSPVESRTSDLSILAVSGPGEFFCDESIEAAGCVSLSLVVVVCVRCGVVWFVVTR